MRTPEEEDRLPIARLAVGAVLVFGLVGAAATLASGELADREARRISAQHVSRVAGLAAARLDQLDRSEADRTAYGSLISDQMRLDGVRAMRVWGRDGTLLWADDPGIVGTRMPTNAEFDRLFSSHEVVVTPTEDGGSGDGRPPTVGSGYEVLVPAWAPTGESVVVEGYTARAELRRRTLRVVLPVSLGALVLALGATLLLTIGLVRRLLDGRDQRRDLLVHTMAASDLERTRLAQDLHDGVVQDLAGVRYALDAIADDVPRALPAAPRERLDLVLDVLEGDLDDLRSMLGELAPPDFRDRTLEQAVHALARHLVPPEIACRIEVAVRDVDEETARLAYKVVREGLRNAVRHSGATSISVELSTDEDDDGGDDHGTALLTCSVSDDGTGLPDDMPTEGHYGLSLLRTVVAAADGRVELGAAPEGGARLLARLPANRPVVALPQTGG